MNIAQIVAGNRAYKNGGLVCVCSAHPDVIEASFAFLQKNPSLMLSIESTVQQVNQDGGYTGMSPADYVAMVQSYAVKYGITGEQYVLAGDHLGPNIWQKMNASEAMQKSLTLIEAYVKAGYQKLHIDPSMPCADDSLPLAVEVIAQRSVAMISKAEATAKAMGLDVNKIFYVIGSEVPTPGGAVEAEESVAVTPKNEVKFTLDSMYKAFTEANLLEVWPRVCGLVVQPAVEFGDEVVFPYRAGQASHLYEVLEPCKNLVFEAHSTDYQSRKALRGLVADHFAILKVGPELTFAWREALLALDKIEQDYNNRAKPILREKLELLMQSDNKHWKNYYHGSVNEIAYKFIYSLSDRVRYYWADSKAKAMVDECLVAVKPCLTYSLVSAYLPWYLDQFVSLKEDNKVIEPKAILLASVERILTKYAAALKE